MSRLDALAIGKACCARLYSYSRMKKREPLIALGSHQGCSLFLHRSTSLRLQTDGAGTKFSAVPHHPMWRRMAEFSNSRLKRTSFARQSKALLRQHKESLPSGTQDINPASGVPPWEAMTACADIKTTVQYLTPGETVSDDCKKAWTLSNR